MVNGNISVAGIERYNLTLEGLSPSGPPITQKLFSFTTPVNGIFKINSASASESKNYKVKICNIFNDLLDQNDLCFIVLFVIGLEYFLTAVLHHFI
jgi:hypothetical protein